MFLLAPLVPIAAALAAPPTVHWASLPSPGGRPQRYYIDGDDLLVAAQDGSLHRWQAGAWRKLDEPPPGIGDSVHGFAQAPDGTSWLTTKEYAWSWRPERGWSGREVMPTGYVFDLAFDLEANPFAVGIHGYVARRTEQGWERLRSLPLGDGVDSNLTRIVFDRDGIGWAYEHYGQMLRIDGSTGERIHLHQESPIQVTLDAQGRALLLGETARYLDDPDAETVIPFRVQHAYQWGDGWWVNFEGTVHWYEAGELAPFPLPATGALRGLLATDSGKLYAVDADRGLYETRPGRAPVLREVAESWGLSAISDRKGTWIADIDADGLDDLLVLSATGELQLLLQGEDSFVEATARWGLDLAPLEHLAVCDLDGNGRPDLLAREVSTDLSEEDGTAVELRYLRTLDGWFEDATDDIQGPSFDVVTLGTGAFSCADVDADGDQDLLVAGGQRSLPPGPRVVLYENVGQGHLIGRGLPFRGLGMAWGGWVEQVVPGDVNADGWLDYVGLVWWNRGHLLLQGTAAGELQDATRGSSLNSIYAWPERGWILPVDDDPYPDLLIAEQGRLPRAWRGGPDLNLDQATQAWGLAPFHFVGAPAVSDVELGDLDGDGQQDLLASTVEHGLLYLRGTPEGPFEDNSDILPRPGRKLVDVALLDLGGDGDLDLLALGEGQDLLLEQLGSSPHASPRAPARSVTTDLLRRLRWLRPGQDAPLLAVLLISFLAAMQWARGSKSRLFLGHRPKGLAALLTVLAAYLYLADSSPLSRSLLSLGTSSAVWLGAWVERWFHTWATVDKLGSYRLLRYLGSGGMGTVFEASSPAHSRNVAVKILKRELTKDLGNRIQFRSEALAMAAIEDDRVVRIEGSHSEERFEDGARVFVEYLVMELVKGASLGKLLRVRGALPPGEVAWVMKEVAEVLEVMHGTEVVPAEDVRGIDLQEPEAEPGGDEQDEAVGDQQDEAGDDAKQPEPKRLVHRDIKPDNIMITRTRGVKLMDFGAVATLTDKSCTVAQQIGTQLYRPPEGAAAAKEDPRSDLWAMGVTLYELLCGRRPFEHDEIDELVTLILNYDPPAPHTIVEGLDPAFSELVMHCLAKEPEQRIQTAGQLAARLAPHVTEPIVLSKEELAPPGAGAPGVKLSILPRGRSMDHVDIAWLLSKAWWDWSRSDDDKVFDALVATLVKHTVDVQGGPDSLVEHLRRKGVEITTSDLQPPPARKRDVQRLDLGASKRPDPGGEPGRRPSGSAGPRTEIQGEGS